MLVWSQVGISLTTMQLGYVFPILQDDVVFLQMYCNYSHSHTGVWLEGNNA